MAVQTSSITTAANGNLTITPNGTGQVRVSPLSGSNNQPVGVDNNGQLYNFLISDLVAATPVGTDELMFDDAGVTRRATVAQIVTAGGALALTGLSVTTAAATGGGALAYNNTNGVFTYTPPTIGGLGGIGLAALSVTTAAAGTATGGLAYNNTTGVFTYTPVAGGGGGGGGIALTSLSVTQAAAAGAGTLVYSNTTGVFTYTPPVLAGLGGIGLGSLSVTTAATGSATGGLAYDNTTGVFTYTPVAGGGGTAPLAATNAEMATGTSTAVYASPATAIAKDAATMTGAAILPGGTNAMRPATPVAGMLRFHTGSALLEFYDGTTWNKFGGASGLGNVYTYDGTTPNGQHTHGLGVTPGNYLVHGYAVKLTGSTYGFPGLANNPGPIMTKTKNVATIPNHGFATTDLRLIITY